MLLAAARAPRVPDPNTPLPVPIVAVFRWSSLRRLWYRLQLGADTRRDRCPVGIHRTLTVPLVNSATPLPL